MSKFLTFLLLTIVVVLGVVLFIREDPGSVLIHYAGLSIETSLAAALGITVVAVLLLMSLLKTVFFFLRIGQYLKARRDKRKVEKCRILLNKGLIDLTEGRFAVAETKFIQLIDFAENPLLNYLMAARAAHQSGKYEQRDLYLKQASETNSEAQVAIGVTQGELQLSAKQTERAYATLVNLYQQSPKHDYVLKLLARVYLALEEWTKLSDLLPSLKKKKLFDDEKLLNIERQTYLGCLSEFHCKHLDELNKTYKKINKELPNDVEILKLYISRLETLDRDQKLLESVLREALSTHWHKAFILRYGQLDKIDASTLLSHAERWQENHRYDADLLLTLGRLARREKLWGKAQSYLEASISAKASAHNCLELAELFENELDKPDLAIEYYQKGLKACVAVS